MLRCPQSGGLMKRDDRRQAIMDHLATHRAATLDDLALRFAVSKMTIHRDLDDLEHAGFLRKLRGGASVEPGTQFESDFRIRARQDAGAKARMAQAAAALVEPGMTVLINDGSMAAVLAETLLDRRPLTVITNNAAVLDRLRAEMRLRLIALGGEYDAKYNGFFGMVTETALSRLRADLAFISSPAVNGLSVFHMDADVVRTKRAMMAAAGQSCLLVNHKRFGTAALHLLADLTAFQTIITDDDPGAEARAALDSAGLSLTIATEAA